jgi:hypothetical protein
MTGELSYSTGNVGSQSREKRLAYANIKDFKT